MTGVTVIMPYHRKDERVLHNLARLRVVRHVREVLLVNDGCAWEPHEEIASLLAEGINPDQAIRLIRNKRGSGVSGARNTGIVEATQPLVCFLDYDDLLLPDRFDRDMAHFKDPGCHATVSAFETVYEDSNTAVEAWSVPYADPAYLNGLEFFRNTYLGIPHLTCFTYRRATLMERGIFFDEDLRGSEDSLFKYRCVESMGFRTSPEINSVRITRHAHNTTSDVYSKRLLEYRLKFFRRFSNIFIKYPLARRHFGQSYFKTLRRYVRKAPKPLLVLEHAWVLIRIKCGLPG